MPVLLQILCDALADAASEGPDLLVDVATLTGAARAALGADVPAVFSTDDEVWAQLESASQQEVSAQRAKQAGLEGCYCVCGKNWPEARLWGPLGQGSLGNSSFSSASSAPLPTSTARASHRDGAHRQAVDAPIPAPTARRMTRCGACRCSGAIASTWIRRCG